MGTGLFSHLLWASFVYILYLRKYHSHDPAHFYPKQRGGGGVEDMEPWLS